MGECSVCGSDKFRPLFNGKDRMFDLPGQFDIVECQACGVVSTHPSLPINEMNNYYPESYDPFLKAIEDEKNQLIRISRTIGVIKRCKAVLKQSKVKLDGRILDIGCSTGVFLHKMSEYGWRCNGVEPSEYAADYARNRFNLSISNSYLTTDLFPSNYFDIITLWDVFEHLPDPISSLGLILNYLKPGGLLVITTPNSSSFGRHIWNEYWAGWDTPRHYHVFNVKLLKSLLQHYGFHDIETRSFTNNYGLFLISLQFYLKEHVSVKLLKFIISIFKSLPIRILSYPYIWFSCLMGKPSSMTFFARKLDTPHSSKK